MTRTIAVVVTGATGNVGRPLVTELAEAGIEVRAVTRRPEAAAFPPGVIPFASAFDALPGAAAAFLNSRALGKELPATVAAACEAGVRRLVALSAINVEDDFSRQPSRFRGDRNLEVERLVVESGREWVSLRPSVFASNFAGMWAPQLRAGDVVHGPYAGASTAPIADGDVSAVAVRALLTDDLVGLRVPLTGSQSVTNAQLLDVVGTVLGRKLTYREVPKERVQQRFLAIGFSTEFADAYLTLLAETVDRPALVTHDVEKILDRPAQTFADWVGDHRHLFTER